MQPTPETYDSLNHAYKYFNRQLFNDRLPACLLTLQRRNRAYGYFWGDVWSATEDESIRTDEIALNPDAFREHGPEEVLSTLVHEMCHLEQHHYGKPSRGGYHNKEWAGMMLEVGLTPSDTGEPGGKMTGESMDHLIDEGGRFQLACGKLLKSGFTIPWEARTQDEERAAAKTASKTKYTCPECSLNAWAKRGVALICGDCEQAMHENAPV